MPGAARQTDCRVKCRRHGQMAAWYKYCYVATCVAAECARDRPRRRALHWPIERKRFY